MRRVAFLAIVVFAGCSWARFDEVAENAPVVLLKKPKQVRSGFGSSLVGLSTAERGMLFVGGTPGVASGALFDLGLAEKPTLDAVATGFCRSEPDQTCYLAQQPAAVGATRFSNGETAPHCFAVGVGSSTGDQGVGVIIECSSERGQRLYALAVPAAFATELRNAIEDQDPVSVTMAATQGEAPSLVVASARHGLAWFYPNVDLGAEPSELVPESGPEPTYGANVAAVGLDGGQLYAVAAPGAGRVHLFAAEHDMPSRYVGCVVGTAGFGRALAVGPLLRADPEPALVISDAQTVHVFSSGELWALDRAADCTPAGDVSVAVVSCDETADVTGCESSDFGHALAVGDLDGDGDGEIAVGAPELRVRDVDRAGAVLIYDFESAQNTDLTEIRFVSSAARDDGFGSSLAVVGLQDRQLLAAGALGSGKTALLYCLDLLTDETAGPRCR